MSEIVHLMENGYSQVTNVYKNKNVTFRITFLVSYVPYTENITEKLTTNIFFYQKQNILANRCVVENNATKNGGRGTKILASAQTLYITICSLSNLKI